MVVKKFRVKHKMSLRELAEKTGISSSLLCKIENGKYRITDKVAAKLAPVLRRKKESLIDWTVK